MQKKDYLWIGFILALSGIVLWFSITAATSLYRYSVLTATTPATSTTWSVEELSFEFFALRASYTFNVNGKVENGEFTLKEPIFRNARAAQDFIPRYQALPWKVWYDPSGSHHSALQKNFPFKECLYATLLWGLLLYFIGLAYYVSKYPNKD